MERTAIISPCGLYRYNLGRKWSDGPSMTFVMINPSIADASIDDPTIRRCIGFAKREGCGAIDVVNLCAFRATDPEDMLLADDPIGPENEDYVMMALQNSVMTIAAWGANAGEVIKNYPKVLDVVDLVQTARKVFSLGSLTKSGFPRHPLYASGDAPLIPFSGSTP
ncbi:MAG: DUF1643 domain-containing protein [Acetobacter sp.]|uniref:DUF1643 domain-containing protein n=1 Tax=Acetobacter sp. TaxID=440 RepID=UPI0039E894E4